MQPYVYRLADHLRYPDLPLCVQRAVHRRSFRVHTHDFSELLIILGGRAVHLVEDRRFAIGRGDVFVIHGATRHGFAEADDLELVNLIYDPAEPPFAAAELASLPGYHRLFTLEPAARARGDYPYRLNLAGSELERAAALAGALAAEYEAGAGGYRTMLGALATEYVVLLSRLAEAPEPGAARPDAGAAPLARALAALAARAADPELGVADLAAAAGLGPRQLDRLFRRYLGTPPRRYLLRSRLEAAARRLRERPDERVAEVARSAGFADANYFSRAFAAALGLSPRAFRRAAGAPPEK